LFAGCSPKDDPSLPHTLADLNKWYVEPPPDLNAAPLYQRACIALNIAPADYQSKFLPIVGNGRLPSPGDRISPGMQAAMGEFLQRNQAALDLFEKAAALNQCRYPVDLTKGRSVTLPHLNKLRQAARVIRLAAVYHALSGDGAQAGQDVLSGFALAKSLELEPTLMSQTVRSWCIVTAANALEETLGRVAIPTGTLSLLEHSLQQAADSDAAGTGLIRGIVGERAMDLAFFDLPVDQQKQLLDTTRIFAPIAQPRPTLDPSLATEDRQFLTESYLQILNDLTKPFPARRVLQKYVAQRAAEAWKRKLAVSAVRLQPLEGMASREEMMLVYLRLAQTAVALEHYRASNQGHYPDSLKQLVPVYLPAIPRDPFVGKKLLYQQGGGGYFVYSVGPDGKDHGGLSGRNGQGDIVFSLSSPPPLAQ
jgi:hypothetical protein